MSSAVDRHRARSGWRPPSPSRLDLHSHTCRSDGLLTPSDLASSAAAAGIRLLAITDHDTLAGVRELRAAGDTPPGLEVLPGIELNSVLADPAALGEGEVHVLGLGVDPDDEELEAALAKQRERRRARFDLMVARLRNLGMSIDGALERQQEERATTDEDALGRPRIARALIACGYATSVEDAFERHLSKGRPAYVPRLGLNAVESIRAIRKAGGLASLAHFAEAPAHLGFLRELQDEGLNGLEVYYRAYDQGTVGILRDIAKRLGLVMTGGSDYHGDRETYAEAHAELYVPDEVADGVRSALRQGAARST
ncbi:MAG TPA: PHP domain-containing protein [Candidatus Limnocylindrales bacterium]|nr:PHP domain-containing protein [Candidatus Limnocylindrales bacterium]